MKHYHKPGRRSMMLRVVLTQPHPESPSPLSALKRCMDFSVLRKADKMSADEGVFSSGPLSHDCQVH